MPNFLDLKNDIIEDLNRGSDAADQAVAAVPAFVTNAILRAQREFYYATPVTVFLSTVENQSMYPVPDTLIAIQIMRLQNANTWQSMTKIDYTSILAIDTNIPASTSIPTLWAPFDRQFRLFQAPDKAYPLELTGLGRIPVPSSDAQHNFWTDDARFYIRFMTVADIYLARIKDQPTFQAYAVMADNARLALVRETYEKVTFGQVFVNW